MCLRNLLIDIINNSKLKTRYQKEVMQEYEAHALEKNAKKELENYINTRKRWRKMILSDE